MKPNALDSVFKSNLKDQQQIPKDIRFNKNIVLTRINSNLSNNKSKWRRLLYAAVLIGFIFSCFLNWRQQTIIKEQAVLLSKNNSAIYFLKKELYVLNNKEQIQKSIKERGQNINSNLKTLPIASVLSTFKKTQEITINTKKLLQIKSRQIIVDNKTIVISRNKKEKMELPVHYESEYLAANSQNENENRSFIAKLRTRIKNY